MSATIVTTKITLGQVSDSILELIENQGLDLGQIRNAVNSALGQMAHDAEKDGDVAVMKWKKATKKTNESFRLTEKLQKQFVFNGSNGGIRFYLFNQDLLDLEQKVGTMNLADWPSYLESWMVKFKATAPTPAPAAP